jgi:acetyl/propionyl-CoA carboxylase alpha subunit
LEKALLPVHQLGVQILADAHGNIIHAGEREGSLIFGNRKVIEEAPAVCLAPAQREHLWQLALTIAHTFEYRNVGTVEFLMDAAGAFYFTEIKARIQIEHPLTEMLTGLDLVREQIRLAAGEPLSLAQSEVRIEGCAMQARISAQDPWNRMMPSPGRLDHVRLPGGPGVRTDTFVCSGCQVPAEYDPLIAKLVAWGADRSSARRRLDRALGEFKLGGTATTLPLAQRLVRDPAFVNGTYAAPAAQLPVSPQPLSSSTRRDLAVAVAVYDCYLRENFEPTTPSRVTSGWHRASRRLPE